MSAADRVEMLGADGQPLGWTYDRVPYDLVTEQILVAVEALADAEGDVLLKEVVTFVQTQLGEHPVFPSGRLTNATRYVAADLQGPRHVDARGAPQPAAPPARRRLSTLAVSALERAPHRPAWRPTRAPAVAWTPSAQSSVGIWRPLPPHSDAHLAEPPHSDVRMHEAPCGPRTTKALWREGASGLIPCRRTVKESIAGAGFEPATFGL